MNAAPQAQQLPLWDASVIGEPTPRGRRRKPRPGFPVVAWLQSGRADYSWNYTRLHAVGQDGRTLCGLEFPDDAHVSRTLDARDVECRRCRRLIQEARAKDSKHGETQAHRES